MDKSEIVIYKTKDGKILLQVNLRKDTVWLSQKQIALLFNTQRPAITKHLHNIFRSGELNEKSVCSILEHTAEDGKTYRTQFYNLDAIISVGYRVSSQRATQFRIWATKILKDHLIKGFTFNQKRIKEKGLEEFEKSLQLIKNTIKTKQLTSTETSGILKVITDYANSWILLRKYDENQIQKPVKEQKPKYILTRDKTEEAIEKLKTELIQKKDASELFGQKRGEMLEGIINNLYQTFESKELYPSIEDKASHLLYFIIKDHPFIDGNKRIGSFLFIFFLERNNYLFKKNGEKKFNDNALVALALLIAISAPKQKDIMIKLIMNFISS